MGLKDNMFDIILFYTFFRVHNYYLNIIKDLSRDLRIGVYLVDSERDQQKKAREKVVQTDRMFLELCNENGAHILMPGEKYVCKLVLAPQHIYSLHDTKCINSNKIIGLNRFGSGSMGLAEMQALGVNKIWAYEKKLFVDMLASEDCNDLMKRFDIVEMGSPYNKYPVFDFSLLNIDYLIAYPTPMLIKEPQKKITILKNINKIIDSIDSDSSVCIKLHNVIDGGLIIGKSRLLQRIGLGINELLDNLSSQLVPLTSVLAFKSGHTERIYKMRIKILGSMIETKAVLLSKLSNYYNLGIEHFLPFVKKGIITGISSCIWHALYNYIPVYNCDDQPLWKSMPNYAIYKNFYIPPCHGKLSFDTKYFNKISETSRKADLIKMIRKEL